MEVVSDAGAVKLLLGPRPLVLNDEEIAWEVAGLEPSAAVTVSCSVRCQGRYFISWAHFIARSTDGIVANKRSSSMGGSFFGLKPMGLITHMTPYGDNQRLVVRDVTVPLEFQFAVHRGHLQSAAEVVKGLDSPLAKASIERTHMAEGVRRIEVRAGRVRGVLFLPAGPPPYTRPLVDLYWAIGGCLVSRAAMLASRGFPTLALAWTKYSDLENTSEHYDLEYFGEALDWLLGHDEIDDRGRGAGIVALCGGANIAAHMSVYFPRKVSAVVGVNGMYVNLGGRINGLEVPCDVSLDLAVTNMGKETFAGETGLTNRDPVICDVYARQKIIGHIPVEQSDPRCRFLYIVGGDDLMFPSDIAAARSAQRMREAGRADHVRVVTYPGAGHLIEPPYNPCFRAGYSPPFGGIIICGGNADCHGPAEVAAWRELRAFLTENLTQRSEGAVSKL